MSNVITIKNCKVINEGSITEQDVLINEGRFEKIANDIEPQGEILDATGHYLLPGVIDDQCHFREPGLTEREVYKLNHWPLLLVAQPPLWTCQMLFHPHLALICGEIKFTLPTRLHQLISLFIWAHLTPI